MPVKQTPGACLSSSRRAAMTAVVTAMVVGGALLLAQTSTPAVCATWQACRDEALIAATQGEHETFHDLAWRAVQLRRQSDPDLMYLLARAQSLSGRPHDALVMLRRLAEMGVPTDAATNEDFRRVRALPGWPELQAHIEAAARDASAPSPGTPTTHAGRPEGNAATDPEAAASPSATGPPSDSLMSPASPAVAVASPSASPAPAAAASSEVARFPAPPFIPGGLAYDSASQRLVIGNLPERKLTVVDDGLNRSATLAGAAAGFLGPVAALEIDRARGDLWVISGGSPGPNDVPGSALHKLQLISGRVLRVFRPADALGRSRLVDLAVSAKGEPLVLDAEGPRLLRAGPDGRELSRVMDLPAGNATSLAIGSRGVAFVAYADRLMQVDLASLRAQPVAGAPDGTPPSGLERIRWHRGSLLGVQLLPDGLRGIVQLRLSRDQKRVVSVAALDSRLPADVGPVDLAVFGEELYYLISPGDGREAVVRRVPLR